MQNNFNKMRTKILFTCLFFVCPAISLLAQIDSEVILQKVKEANSDLIALRGYLHERPELSGKEFETSKFLKAEMAKLGLPVVDVPGTGFYAILDTKRPGKTIGLRTGIDTLPVLENDKT